MKFDVIIGNPPYQLSDGGFGMSAAPVYHQFVRQAKKMNPSYLTMIIPARWYSGGKGLDGFRDEMLNDEHLAEIHDFPDTNDCFRGLNIRGGVCYFLWDKSYWGDCKITPHKGGEIGEPVERPLLEAGANIFIRYNEAISILRKIQSKEEAKFYSKVSSRKPFGLSTNFKDFADKPSTRMNVELYRFGTNGFISEDQVERNSELVYTTKVFVAKASPGDDSYPHLVLSPPIVAGPMTCCTETYLVIGPFQNKKHATNAVSYMRTQFFRFLVLLIKNTQDVPKRVYSFVPDQDFAEEWCDQKLYEKYGMSESEIAFIDTLVKPLA